MLLPEALRLSTSSFMAHGIFEARHLGKAAYVSALPSAAFDALLNCLVTGWLEAGYAPEAVAAAEQAALSAYRRGSHSSWIEGVCRAG